MRGVLVDTYALLAAATRDLSPPAQAVFSDLRRGVVRGMMHALIV